MSLKHSHHSISPAARVVATIICVGCIMFCILHYMKCTLFGFESDTVGFLRTGGTLLVLPASLTLVCIFRVDYHAFERVRHDPRTQLTETMRRVIIIAALTAVCGVTLFAVTAALRTHSIQWHDLSILASAIVRIFMMNNALALLNMLLAVCGLPWVYGTIILITCYVIADWILLPIAGDIARYVCFFWYPIGFEWRTVLFQQVIPFIGYVILMILMIYTVFEHRDQLED